MHIVLLSRQYYIFKSREQYAVTRPGDIMLLNLPIILSSNSFLFHLLFPFLFFFFIGLKNQATLSVCTITHYRHIHTHMFYELYCGE